MSKNNEDDRYLSYFQEMLEIQNKNKEDQCISCLAEHRIPTPDDIRETINSLVGRKRQHVLHHHVFWKEWSLRQGMASLIRSSHQASMDICRHDAGLGELARSENFEKEVDYVVGHAVQKDTVAYCALAFGIRDTLKEFQKLRFDIANEVSEITDGLFDRDISEFLRELRNNLLHGRVIIPQWEISYGIGQQDSAGSMLYFIEDLIQSGNWNDKSRSFISTLHGEKIQLSSIVCEHFRLLNNLVREINSLFSKNVTPSEKDFFDIEDNHKKQIRRQRAKILIGQMASGKNPYDYLHKFFDPEALREILRRPSHSKEQVDFIMALKAVEVDWDDELRSMMYQMFAVARDSDT